MVEGGLTLAFGERSFILGDGEKRLKIANGIVSDSKAFGNARVGNGPNHTNAGVGGRRADGFFHEFTTAFEKFEFGWAPFPEFGSEGTSAPEKSFGKIVFGIRYNLLFEFFNLAVYFLNVALQTNIVPTAILESADFSDGIQVSELAGSGSEVVFRFNGREVDAGRYHPAFIELRADGTGIIQNANNVGGDNPQDGFVGDIDVDFGEEFITNLTFDPTTLTIVIPEPRTLFFLSGGGFAFLRRRRVC